MVKTGMVRAVITADNHLNRFYDRMTPQKLSRRRKYLRDGFLAAVEHAIAWPAHLFLIAGDLFDQPDPRNVDRVFVADCLRRLQQAGVWSIAISGNHDTPRQSTDQGGATPQEIYARLGALTYFDNPVEITSAELEIDGMRVVIGGLSPDPAAPAGSDPLRDVSWPERPVHADITVLLLHGQVEGYAPPEARAPIISLASIEAIPNVDVVVVGDTHRPATRRLGDRMLVIPGATERMTFGEDQRVPGFGVLEIDRLGAVEYHRVPLDGQPRVELSVRVDELDAEDMFEDLVRRASAVCIPDAMVRLRLEGVLTRERYHRLNLRRLYEALSPLAFHITVDTGGLLLEDDRQGRGSRGVRMSQQEELDEYAKELQVVAANDPTEQHLIDEALHRLLSHYGTSSGSR